MVSRYLLGFFSGTLVALILGALGCGEELNTYDGDVYIDRVEQIENYRSYERISGRLTLTQMSSEAFSWPELVEVGGELWIRDNSRLRGFNLAGLRSVGADVLVRNNLELTGINLDSLNKVGGTFSVVYNPKLPSCQVSSVISSAGNIGGETTVEGNNDTGRCD